MNKLGPTWTMSHDNNDDSNIRKIATNTSAVVQSNDHKPEVKNLLIRSNLFYTGSDFSSSN